MPSAHNQFSITLYVATKSTFIFVNNAVEYVSM
jgi:hypothetical protein